MIVMIIAFVIAGYWDKSPFIKNSVSYVLDPTFGALIHWNLYIGFGIIIAIISLILMLSQKYLTNQEMLKEIKKEQKYLQKEMKKYKDHPEKLMELNKKQFEFFPKTFEITMKPLIYTSIPLIILFRWFGGILSPIWGGSWIWYYLIGSIIFSSIFKKIFDVA